MNCELFSVHFPFPLFWNFYDLNIFKYNLSSYGVKRIKNANEKHIFHFHSNVERIVGNGSPFSLPFPLFTRLSLIVITIQPSPPPARTFMLRNNCVAKTIKSCRRIRFGFLANIYRIRPNHSLIYINKFCDTTIRFQTSKFLSWPVNDRTYFFFFFSSASCIGFRFVLLEWHWFKYLIKNLFVLISHFNFWLRCKQNRTKESETF